MIFNDAFYLAVEEKMPEDMLNYWSMRQIYHFAENQTYEEFIKETIYDYFEDADYNHLHDYIEKLRTYLRKKRYDYVKRYENSLYNDISDENNPLNWEFRRIQSLSPTEFIKQYQSHETMLIADIMTEKRKEMDAAIDEWKNNKDTLFCKFPVLTLLKPKMKENCLRNDILKITADYISKDLKYDFTSASKILPSNIVYKPFFSASANKITLTDIDGNLQSIIRSEANGATLSVIPSSGSSELSTNGRDQLQNLDKKDLEVYQEIIRIARTSGHEESGSVNVSINYYTIATNINNYTPNTRSLEAVKKSISKLSNRRFVYKKDNHTIDYVLIDTIITNDNPDKPNDVVLILGKTVSQALLQKDIISIGKKIERNISSKFGTFFIYALQGLRFELYRDVPDTMQATLTVDFFESCVQFNINSFKKKVAIIMESLDEYIKKEIIITSYRYIDEKFVVDFKPIEGEDLSYYNDWLVSNKAKKYNYSNYYTE